jgi:hypothetical protein
VKKTVDENEPSILFTEWVDQAIDQPIHLSLSVGLGPTPFLSHFSARGWLERFKVIMIVLVQSCSDEFGLKPHGRVSRRTYVMSLDR